MIESKEKSINGDTYLVTQLPARRALKLQAKLIRMFGPVLAQCFLTENNKNNDIVKGLEILANHIDENAFESLIVELLQGVRKNGMELTPATIDMEFAGDMAGIYQVVWFVIEVNYANFFSMIGTGNLFSPEMPVPTQDMKKTFTRK